MSTYVCYVDILKNILSAFYPYNESQWGPKQTFCMHSTKERKFCSFGTTEGCINWTSLKFKRVVLISQGLWGSVFITQKALLSQKIKENFNHHHMTPLMNLCLNGDILFKLLRSPECLTDGSWLGPIPLQTNEQRSSTKQSLEEKKGRRKTGERKCCRVENVNYKNRTPQQKPSQGKNRRQIRFLKKSVHLRTYKYLSK